MGFTGKTCSFKRKKVPIAIYNTSLASAQSENAQHWMYVGEIDSVISETILKSLFYDFKLFIEEEEELEKVKKELILVKFEECGIPYSDSSTIDLDVFLNLDSFFKLLKEKGFFVDLHQKSEKRFKV